jgi:hypothetical protein
LAVGNCEERLTVCDITQRGCQEQVFGVLACARGVSAAALPLITTLSRSAFEEELRAAYAEPQASEDRIADRAALLLDLVEARDLEPAARAKLVSANIAAYYSPETKEIVIIDRGDVPPRSRTLTLLHELVHAQQDLERDLLAFITEAPSSDGFLGRRAVIEGEATLYEVIFDAALRGFRASDLDWQSFFDAYIRSADQFVLDSGSPWHTAALGFSYAYGVRYVHRAWDSGGSSAVARLYDDPPNTFAVLEQSASVPEVRFALPPPPPGYELISSDTLGAWMFSAFLVQQSATFEEARGAAHAWRGDQLLTYWNSASDRVAAVWRVALGDADVVRRMGALLESALPQAGVWSVLAYRDSITVLAANDAALIPLLQVAVTGSQ